MTGNSPSGRMAPVVPLNRGTSTSYIVDRACINKVVKNNDICFHGLDLFKCSKCKGVRSHDRNNTCLLDSDASIHFTFEKSNFISYIPFAQRPPVKTAANTIYVQAKGTVFVNNTK